MAVFLKGVIPVVVWVLFQQFLKASPIAALVANQESICLAFRALAIAVVFHAVLHFGITNIFKKLESRIAFLALSTVWTVDGTGIDRNDRGKGDPYQEHERKEFVHSLKYYNFGISSLEFIFGIIAYRQILLFVLVFSY